MLTSSFRKTSQTLALSLLVLLTSVAAQAQTPQPTPPKTPAQQDATRPPGTQQNQPVPENARPVPQNPTAPPGTERPNPTAPPGTNVPTQTPAVPPVQPSQPTPYAAPTPAASPDVNAPTTEPVMPQNEARPVPPLPDLTRLGVTSGNTLTLSMNDAIRRALENNNDIEVARQDVRLAETTLRAFQGIYQPIFNINPQYTSSVTPQATSLGGAGSSGTTSTSDLQWNSSVTKLFQKGGGNYDFFFNNDRRTTSNTFSTFSPTYSASSGVTFTQPLWRDRSIDNNRRQIRIQRKRLEQSDADFRLRTIAVISQVQRAYWDLVFALRDQQNQIANLNLTRENLRRVEAQIAAGAVAPLERAEVQTELANRESALLSSTENVSFAENTLKQLILKDPQSSDWTAQITPTDNPQFDSTPVNLNDALEEARKNRPELRRLNLQREINDIDLQYFTNQTKPRIDLQATLSTTGLAGSPVNPVTTTTSPLIGTNTDSSASAFLLSQLNATRAALGLAAVTSPTITTTLGQVPTNLVGGYGQTLRNLFAFNTRNIVIGATINFPLHNKTAEANLAGARIQRTQLEASTRLQAQGIEVEVRNAAQAVETSRRRVLAARAARENAELQLTGEQRLYQVGRSTTFLLFQRENALANARNLELRAETDFNKAVAELQRATSTTLRSNNVVIETPTVP